MSESINIGQREIGKGQQCYIIAEMSANHAGDLSRAKEIVHAAKEAGANCIKTQAYTPDTLTIDCDNDFFKISKGTWRGEILYNLYGKAYTPWDWLSVIKEEADKVGIDFLSTPFDKTAVDFLEALGVLFYKIASFELVDIPLISYVAEKGKPIILSTGMGSLGDIEEAVNVIKAQGNQSYCLLKCCSAYPALTKDMNIRTIEVMRNIFNCPVGLSDHTMSNLSAIVAVSLGANIIEKHFCISRSIENPDSTFSLEPNEFSSMVRQIREAEQAMGKVNFEISENEEASIVFRKSIFVVENVKRGETFTDKNVRVIRPGYGIKPMYLTQIIGGTATVDIKRGTPFNWSMFSKEV